MSASPSSMSSTPPRCDWNATSGYELVLAAGLSERDDRPTRIPLPANNTVAIRKYIGKDSKPLKVDGAPQPTVWLNNRDSSKYKDLISRSHAELKVEHGMLCIKDGNPREQIVSTNGTAVNGQLVPIGGQAMVSTECTVLFGVPHLLPFNPNIKRFYQQLKTQEFLYIFKKIENGSASQPQPPQPPQAQPMRASRRVDKRLTRAMSQPIAKRTRSSLRKWHTR